MALNPHLIASQWLSQCSSALRDADAKAFVDLFLPNGWLRDLLVFTWDIRALEGREKILAYLTDRFSDARITDVRLNETVDLAPRVSKIPISQAPVVEFAFTFECQHGHGRAHVRLMADAKEYRAFTVFTELVDLQGLEELSTLPLREDVTGIPGRDMQRDYADWVQDVEANPHVIIGKHLSGKLLHRANHPFLYHNVTT